MLRGERFGALVAAVARRPLRVLALVALLALGGALLALRLEPRAETDTLVSSSSQTYKETERFAQEFGDEAVIILVKGDLQRTVLTSDLLRLVRLEGCLAGSPPAEELARLPRGCAELAELKPAKVVFGPGTFINTAAGRIVDEFTRRQANQQARADEVAEAARGLSERRGDPPAEQRRQAANARSLVEGQFTQEIIQLALRYGLSDVPSIDNPEFVSTLVFESARGQATRLGTPKARFASLFPSRDSALIQVRLRADLTEDERTRTIELIQSVTKDRRLAPQQGARYLVTGVPVIVAALAEEVRSSIGILLVAALILMAGTLALVFRTRLRLLPLALALGAAALTFGGLSLAGGSLTMASVAVLPVLIGLAVDYAIQFQARFDESRADGLAPAAAAAGAAAVGGPTIATAGLATAAGFLVLLLSPVPMVQGFGALLVVGIVLALVCTLTAGFAVLARFSEGRNRGDVPPPFARSRARAADVADAVADSAPGRALGRGWRQVRLGTVERAERAIAVAIDRPGRVLAIGLAIAVAGWAADTQSEVVSDVRELVPRDLQALRDVNELQEETGVAGEIDVTVRADDITDPAVIAWMTKFQAATLADAGFEEGSSCRQKKNPPELCPAYSLTDIFRTIDAGNQAQVRGLLATVPEYFSQGVVTPDRKTANLAFGIRLQSLERQKQVVDRIRERLDPPPGVTASVVGLPVLAADANGALASPLRRTLALLAALLAVFAVLLLARRGFGRRARGPGAVRDAIVPLIPIALATGWSAGILFCLGLLPGSLEVSLNPMSVTLGALVIAISTEFSVLLSSRYRSERAAGAAPARALELTYRSTGAAVLASGATAIAGFAALIASDIRMLRDFGILTVVDLSVSLLGVLLVLPAALVWAEGHGRVSVRDLGPRRLGRRLPPLPARPRVRRPSLRSLRARRDG